MQNMHGLHNAFHQSKKISIYVYVLVTRQQTQKVDQMVRIKKKRSWCDVYIVSISIYVYVLVTKQQTQKVDQMVRIKKKRSWCLHSVYKCNSYM